MSFLLNPSNLIVPLRSSRMVSPNYWPFLSQPPYRNWHLRGIHSNHLHTTLELTFWIHSYNTTPTHAFLASWSACYFMVLIILHIIDIERLVTYMILEYSFGRGIYLVSFVQFFIWIHELGSHRTIHPLSVSLLIFHVYIPCTSISEWCGAGIVDCVNEWL